MALGKKKFAAQRSNSKHLRRDVDDGGLGLGLELVQYERGLGRKRILISGGEIRDSMFTSPIGKISSRKLCNETLTADDQSRELEDLPLDILVRIVCGVEHEDLKQLFQVSKTIREATLIAKQTHFAYTTPPKTKVFQTRFGSVDENDDEIEAPGAPLQKSHRLSRINRNKEYSGISVVLFK